MVVKSKRGRRRYVVFQVEKTLQKNTVIDVLNAKKIELYVVQCDSGFCVIRTPHDQVEKTIETICNTFESSSSLSISGTLKTLRNKYPILEKTKQKKRK